MGSIHEFNHAHVKERRLGRHKRNTVDPVILAQLRRILSRIEYSIDEYQQRGSLSPSLDFNLNNSIHSLANIRRDLKFTS